MSELALKLIRECKETRATRLDLGNCGLTELPEELFELVWLEILTINTMGNITIDYDSLIYDTTNFKFFTRSSKSYINEIDTKLKEFIVRVEKHPKSLGLINKKGVYQYNITDAFSSFLRSKEINLNGLEKLRNLKVLDLANANIKNYEFLTELKKLIYLNLDNTNFQSIEFISSLRNLELLILSSTTIDDFLQLGTISNLKYLDISSTKTKDILFVKKLYNLIFIDISDTLVTSIEPLLNHSTTIEVIYENCKIPSFEIQKLENKNLVFEDYMSKIEKEVSDLIEVNKSQKYNILDLSNKELNVIPQTVFNMNWLEYLNLSNNFISIIPKEIVKLKKLKHINLFGNPLTNIDSAIIYLPIWTEFIEDYVLIETEKNEAIKNQQYEKAADLRDQQKSLSNTKGIKFEIKYLENPPYEIANKGILTILEYLKQIEKQGGTEDLYEAKLIIVGEGATGKTTLFEKLKDNNHQVGNTPETHGINIHEGLPFTHTHIGDNTFHANLWDFGGQELQYMTHQFFLTPRALYVLMMDARRESPNLAYWFKIISLLGRDREDSTEKVRLLLVFNKRGNSTGTPPQYQDQLKYYEDSLDVHYLEVDFAENDYRFENLQNCIKQSLVTLPIVKSQLPRLWKVVREDLREEAKTESYITTKRFSDICSKHGITEEADQWLLSGYLHQLGSLLHFQNDKGLRRLVILSPQWAVDGVYTFLSDESIARNNGRFTEEAFIALLATKGYNRDDADVILQLMTKNNFDICYEATEGNYVAAQLLPDNAPQYKWFPKEVLQFRYQYPIMPKGLMSRLIVRLSDDIERDKDSNEQIVWKKGVVLYIKLKEGECRVRLREDDAESKAGLRQILIDVMGERDARKYALRKVRDTVDDLHKKWFRSIKADEMVPCCCSECKISDNPQLYKLENLLKRRLKRPDTSCDVSGEDLMIQQLLEGVYDKGEIRDMENQGRY